jgi:putative molybdopterin biosynthesis protein
MGKQEQFLEVIDRDAAERRFRAALRLEPLGDESVDVTHALGRVLAHDVVADADVPSFDRSNFDGFAVRAADTYGAGEEDPRVLRLLDESIATAVVPTGEVVPGTAMAIATGGMLPRGADSVVMIEDTDVSGRELSVRRAVTPGSGVTFAGTDIASSETVLWRGELLTSRETGVLAALGKCRVDVYRQPRVGILSTGDEIVAPGEPLPLGCVYDSNAQILADAVRELGAVPVPLGIVGDQAEKLREMVAAALVECDVLLLSGGTSKGAGDISYRTIRELTQPGIVAHGVALKPGKPVCLAAHHGKPVAVLPGFPTSAIFTFHEFLAPVIRCLGGQGARAAQDVAARMAVRVNSEIGRTEYLLVSLVHRAEISDDNVSLSAYPLGKGSGSVTTFSRADGFVTIARHQEIVSEGSLVSVRLLSPALQVADLVVMGSHCVGLDYLLGQLQTRHLHTKFLAVGSLGGLEAARRGECDLAGMHLLDAKTAQYNRPFLTPDLELIPGYRRMQGIVFRPGDVRFEGQSVEAAITRATADPHCVMVNRNRGSGTRVLVDQLLRGAQPPGYALQPRNHNAVAAAVSQGRADWGLAIEAVAGQAALGFLPVTEEHYDFVVPAARRHRPAVEAFCRLLADPEIQANLAKLGCRVTG